MNGEFAIAVHSLVCLHHSGRQLSSEVLAENICTNPARIRKVMAKLKKAELVITKEGLEGGYSFVKMPADVNLCEICEAVGVLPVTVSWRPGNKEMDCLIASGMAELLDGIYQKLNEACKERLCQMTLQDVEQQIFCNPK